jgi:hypothetical protein
MVDAAEQSAVCFLLVAILLSQGLGPGGGGEIRSLTLAGMQASMLKGGSSLDF